MTTVVLLHASSTLVLAGLIWTIQVVHYPMFELVGSEFAAYQSSHSTRIGALILLPWAIQGVTTAWLLVQRPAGVAAWLPWAGAVAALVTVVVTIAASVPQHQVLGRGFDAEAHARLVSTNWWRTAAWTAHGGIALAILWQYRGATSG